MVDQSSSTTSKAKRRRRGRKGGEAGDDVRGNTGTHGQKATKTATPSPSSSSTAPSYQPHNALLIQWGHDDAEPWYKYGHSLPDRDAVVGPAGGNNNQQQQQQQQQQQSPPSSQLVQKYRSHADAIYRREVQLFGQTKTSTKDDRWVESTMRQGTLKDRVAAMSVVVSTDPVHKFYALDGLLQMAGCSTTTTTGPAAHGTSNHFDSSKQPNSRVAQLAAEALEDLFLHTFLPGNRKLVTLAQRPLAKYEHQPNSDNDSNKKKKAKTKKTLSPRILLLWRFEEMVKEKYDLFLRQYLAHTLHHGALELPKTAALRSAATLLRAVPEGEAVLLDVLANKLGDPAKTVAATAAHELRRILQQHPAMLPVVAREVQQLAHRPHLSRRALYNCVTFLNQLKLTRQDKMTAATITTTTTTTTTKKTKNGVSSPAEESPSLAASLIRTYFRLFEVAIQNGKKPGGKNRNKKDAANDGDGTSRSRLLSALLTGVNRAHPYLPAADPALEEHVDALYRVVHTAPPAARTQSLLLLFHWAVGASDSRDNNHNHHHSHGGDNEKNDKESEESRTARRDRFYRALYATLTRPEMLDGGKHLTMFFNLVYKSMKYDTDTTRQVVFCKRILSMTLHGTAAVAAASLFLIQHVAEEHPVLRTCYRDVWESSGSVESQRVLDPTKREPRGALVLATSGEHKNDSNGNDKEVDHNSELRAPGWEVALAAYHYHPAVPKFVATLGDGPDEISNPYSGDPLKDFALAPFLDKFAYRNPKSVERVANKFRRGESVAERRSGTDSVLRQQFAAPVNDPSFLEKASVDVQDEFFYKFFAERAKRDQIKGIVRHKPSFDKKEGDERDNELEALEKLEEDIDGRNYADFEAEWETDEEEETFVDSLAQKIIDDAADLDGEDADMDGWDDLSYGEDDDSDDDDGSGPDKKDDNASDGESDADAVSHEPDDDAFMDDQSSSDDDNEGDDGAADDAGIPSLDNGDNSSEASQPDIDGGESLEEDLAFAEESSSSEDGEAPQLVELPAKVDVSSTFAAAEDFEELIAKSWNERKRGSSSNHQQDGDDDDDDDNSDTEAPKKQSGKKKRKRRKKQKK